MSWTQPLCDECYEAFEPGREPIKITIPEDPPIKCCICGMLVDYPVWYRLDPNTVNFPQEEKKS